MTRLARKDGAGDTNSHFLIDDVRILDLPCKHYDFASIGIGDFHHLLSGVEMLSALTRTSRHLSDWGCLAPELFYSGDRGLLISVNTDDPKMFGSSLAQEYGLLIRRFGFSPGEIRSLIRQSIEVSWLWPREKRRLIESFETDESWNSF